MEKTPPAAILEESVFAVLTHTVGLQWGEGTKDPPALGQTLDSCQLEVESGLAQLEFIRGSTVILEGPVSFEIKGFNKGSLQRGKLRANVPPVAKGFSVDLPTVALWIWEPSLVFMCTMGALQKFLCIKEGFVTMDYSILMKLFPMKFLQVKHCLSILMGTPVDRNAK